MTGLQSTKGAISQDNVLQQLITMNNRLHETLEKRMEAGITS